MVETYTATAKDFQPEQMPVIIIEPYLLIKPSMPLNVLGFDFTDSYS